MFVGVEERTGVRTEPGDEDGVVGVRPVEPGGGGLRAVVDDILQCAVIQRLFAETEGAGRGAGSATAMF